MAAAILPPELRRAALSVPLSDRLCAEEIRLRIGRQPTLLCRGEEKPFAAISVSAEMLRVAVDIAAASSLHSVQHSLNAGFLTARGGFRVGVAGTAIMQGDACGGFRSIGAVCIRISRQMLNVARPVLDRLGGTDGFDSTLIASPPGGGKTTLLRDCVRLLSDGGCRVSLCDERNEIAAVYNGVPQMDVGRCTDVIDSCPRPLAMEMMLRAMCPQVIAADEITAQRDAAVLRSTVGCGVRLLATAHAAGIEDLKRRPMYRELLQERVFRYVVSINTKGGRREYAVTDLEKQNV